MKVSNQNTLAPVQQVKTMAQRPTGKTQEKGGPRDTVSLSSEAQKMQKAEAARVAALADAIAKGEYQVDLEKLAQAFVSKELL